MPAATSLPLRQRIFDLHHTGLDASAIAQQLSLPPRTVRHLLARWRCGGCAAELGPTCPPGRPRAAARQPWHDTCLDLRRANPGWGAGRIRIELGKLYPGQVVPPRAPCSAG